jgi:hypothetical protein
MAADLAPVYLNDTRVTLQGDPRPKVAKILQAGGRPSDARVLRFEGSNPGPSLGPDEVIDRTGAPSRAIHLRTSRAAGAGNEAIGGVGGQGSFQSAQPGHVQVPGEILRGTEARSTSTRSPSAHPPAGNPPSAQRFAESQSFADPVHKRGPSAIPEGGLRTQDGGSQEGSRASRHQATPTTPATEEE